MLQSQYPTKALSLKCAFSLVSVKTNELASHLSTTVILHFFLTKICLFAELPETFFGNCYWGVHHQKAISKNCSWESPFLLTGKTKLVKEILGYSYFSTFSSMSFTTCYAQLNPTSTSLKQTMKLPIFYLFITILLHFLQPL